MIITNLENFTRNICQYRLKKVNIESMIKALNTMFPDRWEITYTCDCDKEAIENIALSKIEYYVKFYGEVIIYFPEIEITDGRLKHTITDLYVKLRFLIYKNPDVYTNIDLMGMRSSYTLSEIESNYSHSHLPGIYTEFKSFCTGSGPINYYLRDIQKTEEEWLFLFTLLNQYIRWQSTAGRPYRYISQMGNYGIPPCIDTYIAKQILNSKAYKIRNIKYKFSDFGIDVIPSEGMEEEVASLLEGSIYKTYLCFKNPDGEYLVNSQVKLTPKMRDLKDTELFTFKGELIKIKILNERTNEQSNYKPNAPIPDLTKDLCAELSNRLTKAYIKRSRIIPKDTGESSQEHNREDEVLVLSHT